MTDKSLRGLLSIKLVAASGRTPELLGEAGEAAGGVVAGVEAAGVVAAGGAGVELDRCGSTGLQTRHCCQDCE